MLIVGGAYTGLSTALGLASRGVTPMLVERRETTATLPKAWGLNARTHELLSTVPGVAAALQEAQVGSYLPQIKSGPSVREAQAAEAPEELLARHRMLTPAPPCWLPQATVEKILRAQAEELGADLRFGTEMVSWTQDADGVTAVLREGSGGREYPVRADYLVAADGYTSPIRTSLGIGVTGGGRIGHVYVITFDADLDAYVDKDRFSVTGIPGSGMSMIYDGMGTYTLWVDYFPEQGQSDDDFTEDRCRDRIRRAVGDPGLECRIRNARPFALNHQLAERFLAGRVILAGDAAHACPPVGGQGGNLAIQDGYDLAWRLALVLGGQAGAALLDTYQTERRPVVTITLDREVALQEVAEGRILSSFDQTQPVPTPREILGFRYHSPAVRTEAGDDRSLQEDPENPTGRPGCRAPHVRLERDGRTLSTHDLFGPGFVLLTDAEGTGWAEAAAEVARHLGITLTAHRIGDRLHDVEGGWRRRYGIEPAGAVLVRPDAVIAWRSRTAAAGPEHELERALKAILAR
ncbi:FAD-dependent oxidoreductase [Amycolatopsis ultiminotia]|uniref:FAD-dependent oxidoreductase n=1 Tax=Amycolatopsis ultiminotia TaxID=543629 RepID=A0ABP6W2V2_9PSEU